MEAFCTAGGVNDDIGNGGTGGQVTGDGGNVIGGGRNGGNVSLGGLGMVSGRAGGSCFIARWLWTTGITPSEFWVFFAAALLIFVVVVQRKKSCMGCNLKMYPARSH